MNSRVLGLIPARGGSKGVERKNLADLGGKPLLEWTAAAAQQSSLHHVVLSTDDPEIALFGRGLGLDVPSLRPSELATDSARSIDVAMHTLDWFEADAFDALMLLQPTSPFRTARHIDEAISMLNTRDLDSVISVVRVADARPERMKFVRNDLLVDPVFAERCEGTPRQKLPPLYLRNGAVYLSTLEVLSLGRFQGQRCGALVMGRFASINIDDHFDLTIARRLIGDLCN